MKTQQKVIFIALIILGLIPAFARLSIQGWLTLLGLYSFIFFGVLHIVNLLLIQANYAKLTTRQKKVPWISIIAFPLIFLFQFDFGDNAGNLFVYELFIRDFQSTEYDNFLFSIAVVAAILYFINFIIWLIISLKLRKTTS
jgi:hypothetical protein